MKKLIIEIILDDKNRIATAERGEGIDPSSPEGQLLVIGLLENLKNEHLKVLNTLFSKTIKPGGSKC